MTSGRRSKKIVLFLVGVPIVLVGAAMIAIKLYFTEERLKQIILPRVEEATHRTATLDHISLSLLPSLAITLDGFTISNRTGLSSTPLMSVSHAQLDVDLRPLLSGDIHVSKVTILRPTLLLEVNAQGSKNYASGETPSPGQRSTSLTGGLLLADVQITDGILEYKNYRENSATALRGINYDFTATGEEEMQTVVIDGKASVENFSYGSVGSPLIAGMSFTFDHSLEYVFSADSLAITRGSGSVNRMPVSVSGGIAHMSSDAPVFDIHVDGDNLSITDLLGLVPRGMMNAKEMQGNGKADVRLAVTGPMSEQEVPAVRGQISSTHARVQFAGLPNPISDINIVAVFERSRSVERFDITQFSASLGEDRVQATLSLVDFDDPTIAATLNGRMNLANLRNYYPVGSAATLSGSVQAGVSINGKVKQPSGLTGSGSLDLKDVTVSPAGQTGVSNMNGTVSVNNTIIQSRNLAMVIGESDLSLSFVFRNYLSLIAAEKNSTPPSATVSLSSRLLRTSDIMADTTGKAKGAKGSSKGTSGLPVPPSLAMDVAASINTLRMEKMTLQNVRANLRIAGGAVTLSNFSCSTFGGEVKSAGRLGLENPKNPAFNLSFDMSNIDSHSMLSEFTSFGSRLFGKLSLQGTLRGTVDDTLGLNAESLNGKGTIRINNGRLIGVKVNQEIASRLSLPSLEEIPFAQWSNDFTIRDGRILIRDLAIKGSRGDYIVNGSQGFDGSLDYDLGVTLPAQTSVTLNVPGFAGEALGVFKEPDGRYHFDFRITGNSERPTVALQTDAARARLEEMAKQKIADEKKKLEDQLKKKGEDLLNKFIKKK